MNRYQPLDVPDRGRPHCSRCWFWGLLVVASSLLYIVNVALEAQYDFLTPEITPSTPAPTRAPPINTAFLVDSEACRIPAMDPLDRGVRRFVYREKPLSCSPQPPLVASNLSSLFVDPLALAAYNLSHPEDVLCCYRPFWRGKGDDGSAQFAKKCTYFNGSTDVSDEFVKVVCHVDGTTLYRDYHAFVPPKPAASQATAAPPDAVNVLLVGVDSVSRLNFHRQMAATRAELAAMGAVELLGYNKVGDNTFPNLVAVLAGRTLDELSATCWPHSDAPFDPCPWLWANFSAAGYHTAFVEDAAWMGIFNYLKRGFDRQPTDYYGRPYMKVAEDEGGHKKPGNAKLCVGPRLTLELLLQYADKFVHAMSSLLSFGLFWGASLTHDYLNYAQLGDDVHARFLRGLRESGALRNTVLIFLSDHGMRWGSIRETYQGRLEERLPFLFVVVPAWFRERHGLAVANLRRNARRLTTPFDLHATLLDLVDLRRLRADTVGKRSDTLRKAPSPPRGISLFLPIPENRSCDSAGIDTHWCTCLLSEPISLQDDEVTSAARVVIAHVNKLLLPYRECAELELAEVREARVQIPLETLRNNTKDHGGLRDVLVVVRTQPGDALFEATVRHRLVDGNRSVAGTVSRINAYGSQSACVMDYHMKLYCYCDPFGRTNRQSPLQAA